MCNLRWSGRETAAGGRSEPGSFSVEADSGERTGLPGGSRSKPQKTGQGAIRAAGRAAGWRCRRWRRTAIRDARGTWDRLISWCRRIQVSDTPKSRIRPKRLCNPMLPTWSPGGTSVWRGRSPHDSPASCLHTRTTPDLPHGRRSPSLSPISRFTSAPFQAPPAGCGLSDRLHRDRSGPRCRPAPDVLAIACRSRSRRLQRRNNEVKADQRADLETGRSPVRQPQCWIPAGSREIGLPSDASHPNPATPQPVQTLMAMNQVT